jgi:hypothetical protein
MSPSEFGIDEILLADEIIISRSRKCKGNSVKGNSVNWIKCFLAENGCHFVAVLFDFKKKPFNNRHGAERSSGRVSTT